MARYTPAEYTDEAAFLGIVIGIALKATLKPAMGVVFMVFAVLAILWFSYRMVQVVNGAVRGLPKLFGMVIWLGATFNSVALLFNISGWKAADNISVLGFITLFGYLYWVFRIPEKPATWEGNRVALFIIPLLCVLSLTAWVTPAPVRYKVFNPNSPYVEWKDFHRGYHLSQGYLVDSAGKQIRPVNY
jgi:hypothetical protein